MMMKESPGQDRWTSSLEIILPSGTDKGGIKSEIDGE
jgi:hypothetical protein